MMCSRRSWLVLFLCVFGLAAAAAGDDAVQQQCAQVVTTKLLPCVDYANGREDAPTSKCCSEVTDIRKAEPVCLCFVIQQAHSGSPSFSSLGLKVDRLVKLPGACKISNSSVSDCPKLLNLTPSSPDYSIFTNISSANNTSRGAADVAPSKAFIHEICIYITIAIALVTASFLSMSS